MCTQAGRTPALQQNWQSSENHNILRKNTIFNEHLVESDGTVIEEDNPSGEQPDEEVTDNLLPTKVFWVPKCLFFFMYEHLYMTQLFTYNILNSPFSTRPTHLEHCDMFTFFL